MEKHTGLVRLLRVVCGALAVFGILKVFGFLAAWLIGDVIGGISFSVTNAATIGVIGGADGPTAVFVTASKGPVWELALWSVLTAAGIWGSLRFRKNQ